MTDWTPEQIADAMNATRRNGRALVEEARILFDAGRYARAAALAVLAVEEAGKVDVLRCLVMARDTKERSSFARELTNHRAKNAHWIIGVLRRKLPFPMLMATALEGKEGEHSLYLERFKQSAFYTDVAQDGSCRNPVDAVDKNFANELINCADELTVDIVTTARELELLRQHLDSCESFEDLTDAIHNYLCALKVEGHLFGDPESLMSQLGFVVGRADKENNS